MCLAFYKCLRIKIRVWFCNDICTKVGVWRDQSKIQKMAKSTSVRLVFGVCEGVVVVIRKV